MPSESPDLIIRISLVRDEASFRELVPSVWRTFKVSSSVRLDLLHDKVIVPVMGWTRNYHTYYFRPAPKKGGLADSLLRGQGVGGASKEKEEGERKHVFSGTKFVHRGDRMEALIQGDEYRGSTSYRDRVHYLQTCTSAADAMHVNNIVDEDKVRSPEDVAIGALLREVGDRCIYNYDLGDCWYHCLEVDEVVEPSKADGAVKVIDGAIRCPDEDGDGCAAYQSEILDLLLNTRKDPSDDATARKLAQSCFEKRNSLNVMGSFCPEEFDLSERRRAVSSALGSRNSSMDLVKSFSNGMNFGVARLGQRHIECKKEDDRLGRNGRNLGCMSFHETLNVMPDPKGATLCYNCGSPHNLKMAISTYYCSRECQTAHWHAGHKKQAKKEKAEYVKYCKEVESNTPDPNRFNRDGGSIPLKRYSPGRLRFRVGDFVECLVGQDTYGTGRVVKCMYQERGMARAAPYQIKLDRGSAERLGVPFQQALIFSDWDDDVKIRRLPEGAAGSKKNSAKRGKKGRGKR